MFPTMPIDPSARGPFVAMAAIAGAVVANIYFAQPMQPLIASSLGAPKASIGLIPGFTLFGFAFGLATLLPLGDAVDRKKIVLAQIGLAACFALGSAAAPNFATLLAASFGLGMVSCVPQQMTPFAAAIASPEVRGRAVGVVVSGIMIGLLGGRVAGGALSAVIGWRPVFALAALFMAAMFWVAYRVLPKGRPTTDLPYVRLLGSLATLAARHRTLRRAMATQALLWVAFNAFWANLATMLDGSWGLGPLFAGAFGLVGLLGAFAATLGGRAADRLGPARVLSFSVATVTAAHVILLAAPFSMTALIVGVIALDLGCQSALVANQTRVFGLDPRAQGRINTLYMVATFLGGAAGAAASGWLMARWGWSGVAGLGASAGAAAALVHLAPDRGHSR